MKILYLAHRIPFPPNKGDKIRAFHQLEHLARGHDVWCACFADDPRDMEYVERLSTLCRDVVAIPIDRRRAAMRGLVGLARGTTMTESFYRDERMDNALKHWADDVSFDLVFAFSSSMATYAESVPAARRVLDLCDLDSEKWLEYAESSKSIARGVYRKEGVRLAALERQCIERFDATILITEAERDALDDSVPRETVHVVTNGVSLPSLQPAVRPHADPTVGFVGVMDYRPNVDAVESFVSQCWGDIRDRNPGSTLRIVGRSPTRRVRRLGGVAGVVVTGEVEDVQAEIRGFHVSVAPLTIARGLQNKVLEAMAAAKPVVLSAQAAEGIAAVDGRDYLIAVDADAMISRVTGLLEDAAWRRRIGSAARRFVDKNHRWDREMEKLDLIVSGASSPRVLARQQLDLARDAQARPSLHAAG